MAAEAIAPPSPEFVEHVPASDMTAQQVVDISRDAKIVDQSIISEGTLSPSEIVSFLSPEDAEVADGMLLFQMPEESMTLIDSKLPASARQNGAILSIIYEIEDLAPQFLGYIMGSGRTWWFVTFEEAMNSNIDYVAGFARGYVEEKLWQYTAF